jgi:hypothetical protein
MDRWFVHCIVVSYRALIEFDFPRRSTENWVCLLSRTGRRKKGQQQRKDDIDAALAWAALKCNPMNFDGSSVRLMSRQTLLDLLDVDLADQGGQ